MLTLNTTLQPRNRVVRPLEQRRMGAVCSLAVAVLMLLVVIGPSPSKATSPPLAQSNTSATVRRDEDVVRVVDDLNAFTREIVKRVDSNPTSAGVDDAQKYFDSRKEEIKGKLDSIKNVREAQVSEETKKKMLEGFTNNVTSVAKLQIKYMNRSKRNPKLRGKLDKLTKDYTDLLQSIGQ